MIYLAYWFKEDGHRQGGILAGNQGARLPRNFQAHTKFLQKFTLFWREFDFKLFPYFLSSEGILPIKHNMQELFSCQRKNILALQVINCHKKKCIVTERNLYSRSRAEISCCRKKFLITGRHFLAMQVINCHRKKFIVTESNLLSRREIYCHKKKFLVAGKNF